MRLSEFAGLDAKMEPLMRSAQAGRIVHALMFSGPRGTGKRSVARLLAQTLLCKSPGERPCGVCPACKRCAGGTHPDVHTVTPEKNVIRVEQIRQLTDELSLASYEGGMKIAIVERADTMNESAQNALLKTLEEPSGDALFLLLTDAPGALLPTITSRCLQVRFRCLEPEDCARVLAGRGIGEERARLLAALSQGSVGRALEIDADADYLPLRRRVLDALDELNGPAGVARATARIGDAKGREADVLEILELWARDLMRTQNGTEPLDVGNQARLRSSKLNGSTLLRHVMLARQQLKANVPWVNALESMNFALAEGENGAIREDQSWRL